MKALNTILAVLFIYFTSLAQLQEEKPYVVKSFPASAIKNLKMTTSGGGLYVFGATDVEAKIEVFIQGNSDNNDLSKEEIEERLKNYDFSITQQGDAIVASAKSKSNTWNKKGLSIGFKAIVPQNIITDLTTSGGELYFKNVSGNALGRTSGGSITIKNCKNKVHLSTSGGSIYADKSSGDIDLSTSGGSIAATDLEGKIDLKTSGGSISLDNLKGTISAITSGGSIKANELRGESIVKTSSGSVILHEIYGSMEASTSSGSIDAEILEFGKSLNLSVSSGSMTIKMPMNKGLTLDCIAQKINAEPLNNFNGTVKKESIKGKLNGGGIPVNLKVGSGTLTVR
jgi:hypothetical protein